MARIVLVTCGFQVTALKNEPNAFEAQMFFNSRRGPVLRGSKSADL